MEKLRQRIMDTISDYDEETTRREFGDTMVNEVLGIDVEFIEPARVLGPGAEVPEMEAAK